MRNNGGIVFKQVRASLQGAGMAAEIATAGAAMHSAFAVAMGGRLGLAPEDLYRSYALNIEAAPAEAGGAALKSWFGRSTVVNDNGEPLRVYHGTRAFEGTAFHDGVPNYFTSSTAYANRYAQSHRYSAVAVTTDLISNEPAPQILPVYLKIEKPFDIRLPEVRKIWDEQFFGQRGTGTPLSETGLPDWVDAEDLVDFVVENDLDFDGILLDEAPNAGEDGRISYVVWKSEHIKSAVGNRTFDPRNADLLYQFAGPAARTAEQWALSTARIRLAGGDNPERVRQETGWFVGHDGKWRFEISDADAELRPLTEETSSNPSVFSDWAHEAEHRQGGVPLAQVLDHPRLFAAYPQLQGVRVRVVPSMRPGQEASAHVDGRGIDIKDPYEYEGGPVRALQILLHELQHCIQAIENFAGGGNPRDESLPTRKELAEAINDDYGERMGVIRKSPEYIAFVAKRVDAVPPEQWPEVRGRRSRTHLVRDIEFGEADEAFGVWALEDERRARVQEVFEADISRGLAPRQLAYQRLAGEVEARNTEARRSMTDEERQKVPPTATEDVIPRDIIVRFAGEDTLLPAPQVAFEPPHLPQGSIVLPKNLKEDAALVRLHEAADVTTVVHESAHFFWAVSLDLAARPEAPAQLKADVAVVLRWAGVDSFDAYWALEDVQQHEVAERFAVAFERFLGEGADHHAESVPEAFHQLGCMMREAYRDIELIAPAIPDDVREAFGRLIGYAEAPPSAGQANGMGLARFAEVNDPSPWGANGPAPQ